jgi:hypothetical protein
MNVKKWVYFLGFICLIFVLTACAKNGETKDAVIEMEKSRHFTEEEIHEAMEAVKEQFQSFEGCHLTKLWYSEEDYEKEIEVYVNSGDEVRKSLKKEDMIILFSNFKTGPSSINQGFNPDSTYTDWMWILKRNSKTGKWQVIDWGY